MTIASPNPTPAAIQAALESLYDGPPPEGADDAMERALREPTTHGMAMAFYGAGWHLAPDRARHSMRAEMTAARKAADTAVTAAQAARYAADPFARFDDQRGA